MHNPEWFALKVKFWWLSAHEEKGTVTKALVADESRVQTGADARFQMIKASMRAVADCTAPHSELGQPGCLQLHKQGKQSVGATFKMVLILAAMHLQTMLRWLCMI